MERTGIKGFAAMGLLLVVSLAACHKEESAVAGVAEKAVRAERTAQVASAAAASAQDRELAAVARIPLPTKSLYANVQTASAWANPFLAVYADSLTLRAVVPGGGNAASGPHLRQSLAATSPSEVEVPLGGLAQALVALPPGAWPYGRVIAVAEAPPAGQKDRVEVRIRVRARVRRNVEAVIQQLNDLGIVVQEWPAH